MTKKISITYNEVIAEIDRLKELNGRFNITWDDDKFNIIRHARTGDKILSWTDILKLWEQFGYGKVNLHTLSDSYRRECVKRGLYG